MSRRDFLKFGSYAAVGTWLSLPAVSTMLRKLLSESENYKTATTNLRKLSHRLHPEEMLFIEKIRDVIVAEKMEWIMRNLRRQNGNDSHMVRIWGYDHVDFETRIQNSSEERMAFLRMLKPLEIFKAFESNTLYQVVENEYDPQNDSWKPARSYEIPELKELIN